MKLRGLRLGSPVYLEDFQPLSAPPQETPIESTPEWQTGYSVGLEEGRRLALREHERLSATLVQALGDFSFGYHEARDHITAALQPFFRTLSDVLVPELTRTLLVPRIIEVLTAMSDAQIDRAICLAVSPEQTEAVRPLLAQVPELCATLVADNSLSKDQFEIRSGHTESLLDLTGLIDELQVVLSSLQTSPTETAQHG